MENAIYVGLSQQMALKRHMDIVANNLANMSTTAFKSVSPIFQEYVVDEAFRKDEISFVQDYGVFHDNSEGSISGTGRALDFAISGDGFFTVQTEAGVRYTRNGNFKLDPEGFITTSAGDFLLDERNSPIQVDLTNPDIEVAKDGTVNLGTEDTLKITLVKFDNIQDLKQIGNGYYRADDVDPEPSEGANILQGSLEGSNVNSVLEMTNMVQILRAYESAQKMLDAENEIQEMAIDKISTVG